MARDNRQVDTPIVLGLLFVSGFASLVYQVLWMRELALLFGSTAYATGGTLAVFFSGLAIGGAVWSRRAPRTARPLAEYGLLELGVALAGSLYFGLMSAYALIYTPLYTLLGDRPMLLLAAKLSLAAGVLLPPAILMGGTLPLMSQYVVRAKESLGRAGTLLYGVNTLGAASGALAAGFWLPAWLGFQGTYLVAIIASALAGCVAWVLGRREVVEHTGRQENTILTNSPEANATHVPFETISLTAPKLVVVAIGSGTLALALEVLWTRMFQQVLQNSVYTFSIILVTFLAALAAGAFVARWLAHTQVNPWKALSLIGVAAGLGTLATPFVFYGLTDGMRFLGVGQQWSLYIVSVFSAAAVVLFLPGVAVGSVFPYLLRIAERSGQPGKVVGRLAAQNTAGAIVGSLVAGFLLLGTIGLWASLRLIAVAYFLLAAWVAVGNSRRALLASVVGVVLAFTVINPSRLPNVRLNVDSERVLESWEGPDGIVAVMERENALRIKVNNYYALGSSAAFEHEQNQTFIPLMAHPRPERLFYLGLGTGITAGAALRLPTQEITVTELVPEVVTAAATHFDELAFGLFNNPRARVLARDGRNELRGGTEQYDAILADLFVPWRAGVGSLYSRDHYETARSRLRPGGVYVQWIPLYQVTSTEFWTIVRTFLDVFPQVHVWRGDFFVESPILALVGSTDAEPLSPAAIIGNGQHLIGGANLDIGAFLAVTLPFYAGNLGESREIVPAGPIETDDAPIIEYQAPISSRNARAGRADWFTDFELIDFFSRLMAATPPESDPYLRALDPAARGFVKAGLSYYQGAVLAHFDRNEEAEQHLRDVVALLPVPVAFDTDGERSSAVEEVQ